MGFICDTWKCVTLLHSLQPDAPPPLQISDTEYFTTPACAGRAIADYIKRKL